MRTDKKETQLHLNSTNCGSKLYKEPEVWQTHKPVEISMINEVCFWKLVALSVLLLLFPVRAASMFSSNPLQEV